MPLVLADSGLERPGPVPLGAGRGAVAPGGPPHPEDAAIPGAPPGVGQRALPPPPPAPPADRPGPVDPSCSSPSARSRIVAAIPSFDINGTSVWPPPRLTI